MPWKKHFQKSGFTAAIILTCLKLDPSQTSYVGGRGKWREKIKVFIVHFCSCQIHKVEILNNKIKTTPHSTLPGGKNIFSKSKLMQEKSVLYSEEIKEFYKPTKIRLQCFHFRSWSALTTLYFCIFVLFFVIVFVPSQNWFVPGVNQPGDPGQHRLEDADKPRQWEDDKEGKWEPGPNRWTTFLSPFSIFWVTFLKGGLNYNNILSLQTL